MLYNILNFFFSENSFHHQHVIFNLHNGTSIYKMEINKGSGNHLLMSKFENELLSLIMHLSECSEATKGTYAYAMPYLSCVGESFWGWKARRE